MACAGVHSYNRRGPSADFGGTSHAGIGEPLVLLNQQRWGQNDLAGIKCEARGIVVWIEPIEYAKSE